MYTYIFIYMCVCVIICFSCRCNSQAVFLPSLVSLSLFINLQSFFRPFFGKNMMTKTLVFNLQKKTSFLVVHVASQTGCVRVLRFRPVGWDLDLKISSPRCGNFIQKIREIQTPTTSNPFLSSQRSNSDLRSTIFQRFVMEMVEILWFS